MNPFIKNILKRIGIYHPLQSSYRHILHSIQNKKYRKQYQQYAGSGYTCNICGAVYSRFVPDHPSTENKAAIENNHVIAGYGHNIICPNCMSTARERLLVAVIERNINVEGKKILHLSPEKKLYDFLKTKASVTTSDIVPGFYKTIDKKIKQEDATHFSFADASFDIVIANHVLEHIPDDQKAMNEIYRVLRPGGLAILQVPYSESLHNTIEDTGINDPQKQSALFGQNDHVRIYALHDYKKRLELSGFTVNVLGENDLKEFNKFAIQPGEKFFRITKP